MSLIGQSLGRYHILEQIGEGGMATVYKARDLNLEREVAVKVIRTDIFGSAILERMLKRFQREGRALGKLTHPNIVPILDFGEYNGAPYLVMPYLPGGTLKQRLKGQMPYREALQMLIPVAQALVHAHQQGIVHRDVKPANILITRTGEPMLSDFGIARIIDSEETRDLTSAGVGIGTPEYMAPEQGMGQADERADIYALGIVLYEMITGRIPFRATTPMAVLLKKREEALPRPKQFIPDLPQAMENALIKALARDPGNRYQTMQEFLAALGRLTHDESVTVDMPREKKSNSMWILAGIGGIVALAVCGMGVFAVGRLIASNSQPTEAPYAESENSPDAPTIPVFPPASTDAPLPTFAPEATATNISSSSDVLPQNQASMIFIQAGEFRMGSDDHKFDEKPSHVVTVASFWIDKTEVTNAMYAECVQAGECNLPSSTRYYNASNFASHPVVNVTWNDARNYCEWKETRLPTEAEWEKAASWDEKNKEKRDYPWGFNIDCSFANHMESCVGRTTEVGSYPSGASFYGVLDMAGNVWEWVSDWYDAYPENPVSRTEYGTIYRVVRGGSWNDSGNCVRTSCRGWVIPEYFDNRTGFRCAMDE